MKMTKAEKHTIELGNTLQKLMETYPNVSLRKIALATKVSYASLLKKGKEPILGQIYNPEDTNYAAIAVTLEAHNIDVTSLDWVALNVVSARKETIVQKDMNAFQVGMQVYLRRDNTTPYEIVYKTETHVVLMKVGTNEPQVWSNNTFLYNGPSMQPRSTGTKTSE